MESYIDAIVKEIKSVKLSNYTVKTIYIGGGTPSILESSLIQKILNEIEPYAIRNVEITIEINPGTVNEEKLKYYKSIGINRLSIRTTKYGR